MLKILSSVFLKLCGLISAFQSKIFLTLLFVYGVPWLELSLSFASFWAFYKGNNLVCASWAWNFLSCILSMRFIHARSCSLFCCMNVSQFVCSTASWPLLWAFFYRSIWVYVFIFSWHYNEICNCRVIVFVHVQLAYVELCFRILVQNAFSSGIWEFSLFRNICDWDWQYGVFSLFSVLVDVG